MNRFDEVQARYDAILAGVPAEQHRIFGQEATYVQNCTGGRRSDALRSAVRHGLAGLTSPTAIAMRDAEVGS